MIMRWRRFILIRHNWNRCDNTFIFTGIIASTNTVYFQFVLCVIHAVTGRGNFVSKFWKNMLTSIIMQWVRIFLGHILLMLRCVRLIIHGLVQNKICFQTAHLGTMYLLCLRLLNHFFTSIMHHLVIYIFTNLFYYQISRQIIEWY